VEALTGLKTLLRLTLQENAITDITPLGTLSQLVSLNLSSNAIEQIDPLAGLLELKVLLVEGNQIRDVSALRGLKNLLGLWLGHNEIVDLAPLLTNDGLDYMDRVYLCGNPIHSPENTSTTAVIDALTLRGVFVYDCP